MWNRVAAAPLVVRQGNFTMTVPALIIVSLLALVAFPFFAQISGGSSAANRTNRSIGVHGQKDSGQKDSATSSQNPPSQES